jgi:DNA-binding NtrC family response regulator
MVQTTSAQATILIAVPDEWREELSQLLEREGFFVKLASSMEEALSFIRSQSPNAVVMISDWAMASDDEETDGLMKALIGKIPTVCLITPTTWHQARNRWFDELYRPPLHEYCSVPVGIDQLILRLRKVLEAATRKDE